MLTPEIFRPETSSNPSELLSISIVEVSAYHVDLAGYASP